MAQITGSSTIDWSGVSLAQVNFETDIVQFANRVKQIVTAFVNRRVYSCSLVNFDDICSEIFLRGEG